MTKQDRAKGIDPDRLKQLLKEPLGTPLHLTREEAIAVVEAGIGGRPDLPSGKEYVRRVRRIWRGPIPRDHTLAK